MMFEEESIMKDIQNVLNRIEIYEKKAKTMGLSASEEKLYAELAVRYVKLRLYLFDSIFDKYILPDLLYGEADELAKDVHELIGWSMSLLINKDEIDTIYNRYGKVSDKKEALKIIKRLHKILRKNLMSVWIGLEDREIWECISVVMSDGESKKPNILLSHLDYKLESIYMALREENE